MDRHVAENTARARDVGYRRRTWVARGQRDHLDIANLTRINRGTQCLEVGVKAALEADHQGAVGLFDCFKTCAHAGHVQIDGFFAKHRFAGARELFDQIGVGVGWRADHHSVDVVRGGDVVNTSNITAKGRLRGLCRGKDGVGDCGKLCALYR